MTAPCPRRTCTGTLEPALRYEQDREPYEVLECFQCPPRYVTSGELVVWGVESKEEQSWR